MQQTNTRQPVTGLILAGGLGRRMGRIDKGLQVLAGRPMVERVLERFAPQVDELLINANQNPDRYGAFGYPVLADLVAGHAGPLAGLHAGLARATTPLVATAPCDSPFLPTDLVARLYAGLLAAGADLAVARTGDQPHPVFCLCRRGLAADLEAYLAGGGRRFGDWYGRLNAVEVDFDGQEAAFSNINTEAELAEAAARCPA